MNNYRGNTAVKKWNMVSSWVIYNHIRSSTIFKLLPLLATANGYCRCWYQTSYLENSISEHQLVARNSKHCLYYAVVILLPTLSAIAWVQ